MKRKNELINKEHSKKAHALYVNKLIETDNKESLLSFPKNNNLTHKDINGNLSLDIVKMVLSDKEYDFYVKNNFKISNFFQVTQHVLLISSGIISGLTIAKMFNFNAFPDLVYSLVINCLFVIAPISFLLEFKDIKRLILFKKEKKRISNK